MTYTTPELYKMVRELQAAFQHLCNVESMMQTQDKGFQKMVSQCSNYIHEYNALYGESCVEDETRTRERSG